MSLLQVIVLEWYTVTMGFRLMVTVRTVHFAGWNCMHQSSPHRYLKISSLSIKEQAYNTLVRPLVEYASPVWDPHHQTDIRKLESVQRRVARFVLSTQHNRSSKSFKRVQAGFVRCQGVPISDSSWEERHLPDVNPTVWYLIGIVVRLS
jgi:hypothetical protein